MSAEALATCWGDLPMPASGVSAASYRLVAVAVADVVNDMNDNRFYARLSTLARKTGLNRDTVRRCMVALVDSGVLEVVMERDGDTTIYRWTYWPDPTPKGVAATPRGGRGETARGVAATPRGGRGETATYNSNELKDELNPKPPPSPPQEAGASVEVAVEAERVGAINLLDADESFDAFWKQYPRGEAKPQARTIWGRMNVADRERALEAIPEWRAAADNGTWTYIPYAQKWLREQRWLATPPRPPRPEMSRGTEALLRVAGNDPRLSR